MAIVKEWTILEAERRCSKGATEEGDKNNWIGVRIEGRNEITKGVGDIMELDMSDLPQLPMQVNGEGATGVFWTFR